MAGISWSGYRSRYKHGELANALRAIARGSDLIQAQRTKIAETISGAGD
jgi:hypothetical protein